MADNVRATPSTGSTGALFASDEMVDPLGSTDVVHIPLTKLVYGAANAGTVASSGNPFPVFVYGSTILTANVTNTVTVNVTNTVTVTGTSSVTVASTVNVSGSTVHLGTGTANIGTVHNSSVTVSNVVTVNSTGGTVSVSGSTISVSGSTLSVSGSTVSITGVVTINSTGGVYSVSGSTVSVSGSTLSVSGSTVSVVNGSTFLVQDVAAAFGGADPYSFLSSSAVHSVAIKASAGTLYSAQFTNLSSGTAYAQFYNQTTTPASTDNANIVARAFIPGSSAGAGIVMPWPKGLEFTTGIGLRVSGGRTDTNTTVLSSDPLTGNVSYQ